MCALAEVTEAIGVGDNHLFHTMADGGESIVEFGYHTVGNHTVAFQGFISLEIEPWNHAVVVGGIGKHAALFES